MKQIKTTAFRKLSILGFDLVIGSHNFFALLDFDVTDIRSILRDKRKNGEGGSLFSFILKAIAKCLEQYPECNSMIDYRNTTTFDEVDINIPIEIEHEGRLLTKQYIIKDANKKSVHQITNEIDDSKKNVNDESGYVFSKNIQRLLNMLPKKISIWLIRHLMKNHKKVKELSGTVFVTSVTMFSNVSGYIIPYIGGPKAVSFAVGSVVKKPVVKNDQVVIREMINITAIFNHDIIDGAPAARFINKLRRIIETEFNELL